MGCGGSAPLPASARVASPDSGAGGGALEAAVSPAAAGQTTPTNAGPRPGPPSPVSVVSSAPPPAVASDAAEDSAGVALLRAAHHAFPTAAIQAVSARLLRSSGGGRPLTRRLFEHSREHNEVFISARDAFRAATTDAEWPAPPAATSAALTLARSLGPRSAEYMNAAYTTLEYDFILKVPLAADASREWADIDGDPFSSAGHEQPFFFSARQERADVAVAAALAPVPAALAEVAAPTAVVALKAADVPTTVSPPHRRSFTDQHYAQGACLYIVGEVYAPLATSAGYRLSAAKKLVQAERLLQFLRAKERVADVCDCVLGFVFMGPHMDVAMGATLLLTLEHYQRVLPCVWALQCARRLLGLHVAAVSAAVAAALNGFALVDVKTTLTVMQADITELKTDVVELKTDMKELKANMTELSTNVKILLTRTTAVPL